MDWWIIAFFLCLIEIVGDYLSIRLSGEPSGRRAGLALAAPSWRLLARL
jgi:hypothetical protein